MYALDFRYHPGFDCDGWKRRGTQTSCIFCETALQPPELEAAAAAAPDGSTAAARAPPVYEEETFAASFDGRSTFLEVGPLAQLKGPQEKDEQEGGQAVREECEECSDFDHSNTDDSDDGSDADGGDVALVRRIDGGSVCNLASLPTDSLSAEACQSP